LRDQFSPWLNNRPEMKIKTKILWTSLGMSLLVVLVGAFAVNRQHAAATVGATKEAQNVADLLSILLMSESHKLPASSLQEIVVRLHQAQGRDVVLMDSDQVILADAIPSEIGKIFANDPGDEVGATIKDRQVRTFVEVSQAYPAGIKQIVVPVEGESGQVIGAVVLEYTPLYDELMHLTRNTTRQVFFAGVGSVAIALLITLYMGRSIARPLQQLTRVTTGFAFGRMDLPMPPPRNDEIGELAAAFTKMVQKRWLAETELQRVHEGLEVRVVERTAELAQSNEALQSENIERKRAEQASERTLQRLNDAQRIGQIGDWERDIATETMTWSPQVFEIVGRDPSLGPPSDYGDYATIYDAANAAILQENVTRAIESGEAQDYELAILRPDGERVHVQAMAVPRKDESGRVVALFGTIQDITERKRASALLLESQQRLTLATESARIGIWDWNVVTNQLVWDAQMYALYGIREQDFSGAYDTWQRGLHPEDRDRAEADIAAAVHGVNGFHIEFRVLWPNGEVRHIEAHALVQRGADGSTAHMIGVNWDITERKRVEEALRTSEAEFRTVAEAMPQMVWITRPDGENTYFSRRWMDYTGLTLEESLGHGWNKPFHPDDKQRAWDAWHHATATSDTYSLECRLRHADGAYRWWLARAEPLKNAAGRILKWFGTYTDIHELKLAELEISRTNGEIERLNVDLEQRVVQRTEEFFAATQEAERANRAKSDFLGRTSHELRTPMNAILGFSQLLEMEESLGPEPRESVEQILNAGRHLMTLIDEVLDISTAESGTMTLSLEPVAVDQLIAETLSLIGSLESRLRIEVERASPAGGNWKVLADPQRLKQVLLNLLSNAIKYNRPDGKVTVEFAPAEETDPPAFRFSVQDTGPGISPEKLPRLFTPFDRLDAERTKTHIVGTGLGLALSKRMIELMGGRIGVESVVGEGSTFWVEVPLAESPVASLDQTALPAIRNPQPEARNVRTLLYIEDNPSNLRLVTRILARRPAIQLLSAGTGALGLKMALGHRPDLILLDLHLPDMNGDQVLAQLRADSRTAEMPVVMLSADNLPDTRERMLAAGARAFLAKPVEVRTLLGVFDRFIESSGADARAALRVCP
jgi:PAS domain S-box-containing protein